MFVVQNICSEVFLNVQNMFTHSTNVRIFSKGSCCQKMFKNFFKTLPISSDVRLFPKMNEILQNGSYFLKLFGVSKIIHVSKNIRQFININLF